MRIAKWYYLPMVVLFAALPMTGCRQMIKEAFKTPKVELLEVELDSNPSKDARTPWRFVLTMTVDNPNPYPLSVSRFVYTGMIGGEVVAEGEQADETRIAASGVTTVRVPITLKPGAFETAARQVITKKSLSWEINGAIGLQTHLMGVVRIPFSKSGNYDMFYILKRMGIGLN